MKLSARLLHALAVCCLCSTAMAAQAGELAPLPRKALPPDPSDGRVVVKFKDDTQWRKQIQSARQPTASTSTAVQVQALLAQRADALGSRRGVPLQAGEAVSEHAQVVKVPGISGRQLAALLAADPQVEYAVPDGRSRALRVPNDPLYPALPSRANGPASGQWYLRPPQATGVTITDATKVYSSIDAEGAWNITAGHATTVVAVLDTGIRREHPDLANKVLAGYDMVNSDIGNDGGGPDTDPSDPGDWITSADKLTDRYKDCDVTDSSWHGTKVAGLIAAATNNATGMAGAGWNTRILPVRVLGKCFGYDSDIVKGMRWAAGLSVPGLPANPNPAKVINLSLGGEGACTTMYQEAVNEVVAAGAVVVVAAGNTSGRAVNSPANCTGVIGVVGLRHLGTKVGFSDLGPEISIAAPGGNCVNVGAGDACLFPLLTTTNAGTTTPGASSYTTSFDYSVGTSFSAPLVSATVALMRTANRTLTPAQVRQALQSTARPFPTSGAPLDAENNTAVQQCHAPTTTDQLECYCTTSTCGAGMLDARAAVTQVARLEAYIDGPLASVALGQAVTLGSSSTVLAPGRTIASRQWTLLTPGAGVADLGTQDATAASITLTPSADGVFVVQLTVTDNAGASSSTTMSVTAGTGTPPPPSDSGGGGGGGALSAAWLAALALAVWLSRPRRRT